MCRWRTISSLVFKYFVGFIRVVRSSIEVVDDIIYCLSYRYDVLSSVRGEEVKKLKNLYF